MQKSASQELSGIGPAYLSRKGWSGRANVQGHSFRLPGLVENHADNLQPPHHTFSVFVTRVPAFP